MTSSKNPSISRQRIHDALWSVVAEQAGKNQAEFRPEHRLMADLGLDSLDVAEVTMKLEEELHVQLPEEALEASDPTLEGVEQALATRFAETAGKA